MGKIRIYELAKELHQDSKTIISQLKKMEIEAVNHMSTIDQGDADKIRQHFTQSTKSPASDDKQETKKSQAKEQAASEKNVAGEAKKTDVKKGRQEGEHKRSAKQETSKQEGKKNGRRENNEKQRSSASVKKQKNEASHHSVAAAAQADQTKVQNRRDNKKKQKNKDYYANHEEEYNNASSKKSRSERENSRGHFGKNGKNKNKKNKKGQVPQKEVHEFAEVQYHVVVEQTITVQELAKQLGKKASEIIMKLMSLGVMATMNQELDYETAAIIAEEYGATIEMKATMEENLLSENEEEDRPEDLVTRPPVVTIMGHVDHGKTSLLDQIRNSNIISTEAGGITQHIGAYQVAINGQKITFLDTPGHEAFTAMRARGAQITDIAILVVAADDGVMPQTIEAIDHAKAAGVPIIVAINKIDKPDANPETVKTELTQYGLVAEDWGGDTIMVPVSAKKNIGINDLLEMILLVAEMEDLKANPKRSARGKVIESKLDKNRGSTATLLVQNGTLHNGDFLIVGTTQGRIRAMFDYHGQPIDSAGPSVPAEILGLNDVPAAGDDFVVVANERLAKQVAEQRSQEKHMQEITRGAKVSLEDLFNQIQQGDVQELNIVLKADTQGSIEAIRQSLEKLSTDEVRVNIIRTAVGGIRETDVSLAMASNAIIIGFNVRPDSNAKKLAEKEQVDVKTYSIIYEAIDDVKAAMSGLLAPDIKESELGQAEVRSVIKVPKVGNIAGCYVTDGKITRHSKIRLLRDGIVIYDGEIASLRRFKDDVREVAGGYECGISLEKYNDFKEGDVLEAYVLEEIKREL
ncbi:MAG: translation initiation factor IF-2 [Peptococcaceae bacterium]|nr:translation initiation factor IF-2 [Peptococcaceae bacterium]